MLKVNSLVDTAVIEALYDASSAGVEIDCIVRGACCLVPGVEGVSDHIRVRSIVGEFLEHSRIWMFANGGRAEWYIGSADLMERNLDRRVEVVTPVEDHEAQARLARIVDVLLADDRRSWQLGPDGRWRRTEVIESVDGTVDTFAVLKDDAASSVGTSELAVHAGAPAPDRWIHAHDRLLEAHPLEVELKYRMTDVGTGERLLATDDLAGLRRDRSRRDRASTRTATSTRDDGALEAAGYAGRLRSTGRGTIITLKGLQRQDNGGATHRREELEGPADPSMPPALWPPSGARDAVVAIVGDRTLRDLVALRQVRRKRNYARNGTVVEVSVDDVEVLVGAQVAERFAELELELRDGQEVDLGAAGRPAGRDRGAGAVESSKFERALEVVRREPRETEADEHDDNGGSPSAGLTVVETPATHGRSGAQRRKRRKAAQVAPPELVAVPIEPDPDAAGVIEALPSTEPTPEVPRILVPKSPGVLADDHLAEAGRKVLRFHLARMVAREAGTREGADAEELHAMRVATRRQRAAWRVFGDAFDPKRTAHHRRRLRLVAADLGAVRDLDVLIESIEAYQGRQPEDEARGSSRSCVRGARAGRRPAASWSGSSTPSAIAAGSTATSRSSSPRARASTPSAPPSPTGCGTRCRPGSGAPTRRCGPTSP